MNGATNHSDRVGHASSKQGHPAECWMLYLLARKMPPTPPLTRSTNRGEEKQQGRVLKPGIHGSQRLPRVLPPLCHPNQCTSHFLKMHVHRPICPRSWASLPNDGKSSHLVHVLHSYLTLLSKSLTSNRWHGNQGSSDRVEKEEFLFF